MTHQFTFYNEEEARNGLLLSSDQIPIFRSGYNVMGLVNEIQTETIWGNYLLGCLKTWNTKNVPLLQIPNAVLGLIGELQEYMETPTLDEFGDVLYYRAILRYLVADEGEIYSTFPAISFNVGTVINLLADYGKKAVYHDKMFDIKTRDKYEKAFAMLDAFLWDQLVFRHNLLSFEPAFKYNLDKLANRHEKGFNPNYDSLNTNQTVLPLP